MRFDDRRDPEAHDPERPPESQVPADPHGLLELQRSAGNAAVGRMIARTFAEVDEAGNYTWHKGTANRKKWEKTGATKYWLFIPYPVYRRKKKKEKPVVAVVEKEAEEEELPEEESVAEEPEPQESEEAEQSSGEADRPVEEDADDGSWTTVRNPMTVRDERDQAADIPGLVRIVNLHDGDPEAVSDRFNTLFRACVAQGVNIQGAIVESYTTSFDRGRHGYSVEVTIPYLPRWVVHAHLDREGNIVPGDNATHYKRRRDRYMLGASLPLLPKQIEAMIPDVATRRAAWTATAHESL